MAAASEGGGVVTGVGLGVLIEGSGAGLRAVSTDAGRLSGRRERLGSLRPAAGAWAANSAGDMLGR
jgi:hypothetical protein